MDLNVAQEIAHMWCTEKKIQAIKLLRNETAFGIIEAKNYLENGVSLGGETRLLKELCGDFVFNKEDLLIQARHEMKRLKLYIEQLEGEIDLYNTPSVSPFLKYCTQCLDANHEGQCERYWDEVTESWHNYSHEYVNVHLAGLLFELPTPEKTEDNS